MDITDAGIQLVGQLSDLEKKLTLLIPDPIPFTSREEVEEMDEARARDVLRVVRRKLMFHLLNQETHEHMSDDCGDYLAAASDNWSTLWNGYNLSDGTDLVAITKRWLLSDPNEGEFPWGGSDGEIRFTLVPFMDPED